MRGGYSGRILRVDLSKGQVTKEKLPDESVLRKYIGGVGLGAKILNDEISLDTRPLSPDNRLIFMTGPLTGTKYPCSSDTTVVTLSANLGFVVTSSHTHGFWGAYLKQAGYDGIIIQGASDKWVYLWIHDGEVEIRDASGLIGQDSHDTEDLVKDQVGRIKVSVVTIGPAGENMVHGASIANDSHHLAAKGGVGAVMGSKKLKAIAVKSAGGVPLAEPVEFGRIVKEWNDMAFAGGKKPILYKGGITRFYGLMIGNQYWSAYKNLLSPEGGRRWTENMVEGCKQFKITGRHCWACPIGCTYESEITTGPHKGYRATLSGGGEGQEGAAGILGIDDPGTVHYLTDINDRLGVDSSDLGCCLALAFELYERGQLTKEQTDGLELTWGNAEAAEALLRKIIYRDGFGKIFAEGPKKAAQILGGDAPRYVAHIKGSGYNMHDWRPAWGLLLGQMVSSTGGTWQSSYGNDLLPEIDLGYPERNPLFVTEGLAKGLSKICMKRVWDDCYGQCFLGNLMDCKGGAYLPPRAVAAATGWAGFTLDEAMTIGHRVITLERIFSMKRGLTIETDLDIGPRIVEPATEGIAKGKDIRPHLRGLVMDYYENMGWERETGRPTQETLEKLDLTAEAEGL